MMRIDAKCLHFNTTKGNIKCSPDCVIKACQNCKLSRKVAKQNCTLCYDERNSACRHTDGERAITGLWTTEEVKKALEKGYKITSIYEVMHFKQSSTDLRKS